MRRILPGLLLLLLSAISAYGQSTVVSGTVTDSSSQTWNNGTITFTFVTNPQYPASQYSWTGGTLPTTISGTLNSGGAYSISLPSNTAISPIGTSWQAQVCSQASFPCFTTQPVTVTGGTQVFNITPPAISISLTNPPSAPVLAYADTEISSALIGSYYYNVVLQNYRFCQVVTGQICTLWNSFGAGPPPTGFPRLDQVTDPNIPKTFNLAPSLTLTGSTLDLSALTSPLLLPIIPSCTTVQAGQICDDGTNYHIFFNGTDALLTPSPSIGSGNDGDVVGYKVTGGTVGLQDIGPVNASNGATFWEVTQTDPLTGDIPCWDTSGPPFANNCTPGAADTSVNGATSTYTISFNDQLTSIDHDFAGSASVGITLPTADTLGVNPGFVFVWSNHSTHTDTVTPTTWTINGNATLPIPTNNACRIRVNPNSATDWIADCTSAAALTASGPIVLTSGVISCPTCGTGSGNLSGTLTAGKVPVASGANTLVDGSILDDNSHAARDNAGYDVNSLGAYLYWIVNNTGTGTTVNKMVCDDGTGKGIICPFATSTTNDPLGSAVAANGATPGTSGSTGVCNIGFCTVVMDNSATANHYAQQSTTVAGDLSDVGASPPTNGQPYWHIITTNSGAGTTSVFRNMDSSELNASSGGNGKSTTVQVNGTSTKNIANFNGTTPAAGANNQNLTFQTSASGNTSSVSVEVPLATTGQAGIVQLAGGLGGTSSSPTLHSNHGLTFVMGDVTNTTALTTSNVAYLTVPFACTINAYNLTIDAGTITVKFWKIATGTAIPTVSNSISTSGVGIASGTAIHSTTVTDFTTTSVAANDIMAMAVTVVATAKTITGVLSCQE